MSGRRPVIGPFARRRHCADWKPSEPTRALFDFFFGVLDSQKAGEVPSATVVEFLRRTGLAKDALRDVSRAE